MKTIAILTNPIQEYAWGSYTAIPELLGKTPSGNPQAELWMGAHPKAPSLAEYDGQLTSLADLIRKYPEDILGKTAAEKFDHQLPYLFKVLAAAKPLSVQAHPNREQAIRGFARENALGISLNDPRRNYKDANHKPECLCAVTQFWGLRGFRKIPDMTDLMQSVCGVPLKTELDILRNSPDSGGLKQFFQALMTLPDDRKKDIIRTAVAESEKRLEDRRAFRWVLDLYEEYPTDIGVLSPLFLNMVCLDPGEAMFLPSGEPHAYLDGLGIELMANSDNVLRGGLTPKHIDVPELLEILNFEQEDMKVLLPRKISEYESVYPCDAEEFVRSMISIETPRQEIEFAANSVQILLCAEGKAVIADMNKRRISISKGMSAIVPASVSRYTVKGKAKFYKASVPV
jgi:mannose-6-phosphate isomerase